jgi:hypothetical protein
MTFLEENKYLGREEFSCPHFWVPLFYNRVDFSGLLTVKKGVKRGSFNVT